MISWAYEIVGKVKLGDERLSKRLVTMIETFVEKPASSIPDACDTWAATEATYRFLDNEAVVPERVTEAMAEATAGRCQGLPLVLAVQDTTSLDFTAHTDTVGLGPLEHPKRRGLFVHTTLAVNPDGGVPLGIISQQMWARDPATVGKSDQRKEVPVEGKESGRWVVSVQETEGRLGASVAVLTVADREADVYELFVLAHELRGQWLIRARHDRNLVGEEQRLVAAVEHQPVCATTTVDLPRTDQRAARRATLEVRRAQVVLRPPQRPVGVIATWWTEHPTIEQLVPGKLPPLPVGVVLVTEVGLPSGVKPVRWLLLTNRPVETTEQALECVALYRLRWVVERYHFVLKSGCQIEKLQLETANRLMRAVVVYSEVAWRLLWLTYEVRAQPDAPCTVVFDDLTWRLVEVAVDPTAVLPLTPPTLRTTLRKIAKLGGFLGRTGDGEPGVKTIWRGLRRLADLTEGVRLAHDHPTLFPPQLPTLSTCV